MTPLALPAPRWGSRLFAATVLATVLLTGCRQAAPESSAPQADDKPVAEPQDPKVLYYYDPMRPDVHFDKPGKSPFMDMDLVPKVAEPEAAPVATGITVDAAVAQTLGIRTARPERRDLRPTFRVPARVVADAQGQARLQARVEGWVERLRVRAVGQSVRAGEIVAEVYAPALVQAQEELLLGDDTAAGAAERLRRLGIAEADIQAVRRNGHASRRLPLRAAVAGVITEIGVREGSRVVPEAVIADIAGTGAVWIEAQLFPAQRMRLGDHVSARFALPGVPGREWRSEAGQVVPVVDPLTQTLAMRFAIDAEGALPLGTVLDGELQGEWRREVRVVPTSAVISTAAGDRVLVEQGAGHFVPRPVSLGPRYGEVVEIVAGLDFDERVVVSGQFLLDAEANLAAGLAQMGDDARESTP